MSSTTPNDPPDVTELRDMVNPELRLGANNTKYFPLGTFGKPITVADTSPIFNFKELLEAKSKTERLSDLQTFIMGRFESNGKFIEMEKEI